MKTEKLNVVDNFLSRETSYYLHNYLKTKTQPHHPDKYHPRGLDRVSLFDNYQSVLFNAIGDNNNKIFKDTVTPEDLLINDFLFLIKDAASTYFNLPKNQISLLRMAYTKYTEGQSLPVHNDYGVSKHDVHSAILYLTDDYEGGEFLWYDEYNWKNPEEQIYTAHKPKSGQLYYFNGIQDGHHEVAEVKSGERGCIVFFYTGLNLKEN